MNEFDLDTLRRRRSMKWRQYPSDVLPLWVAEMDTPLAPPIRAALDTALDLGDTGYAHIGSLVEAFTGFAATRFGWHPDPGTVSLSADVAQGVEEALRTVTGPGDVVVANSPLYAPFLRLVPRTGRELLLSPLAREEDGRYRLDLDRLDRDLATPGVTAYLLVNPHNPTGLVLTRSEMSAVAGICADRRVRLLVDEIHAPLTYPDTTFVPFLSLPEASRALVFHAASKAWNLAGLKAALVVAGADTVEDLHRMSPDAPIAAGLLGVLASEAAFRDGGPWLDDLLAALDANRRLLGTLLAERLPEIGYAPPAGTYLAWLDCRTLDLGDDPAATFLDRGRVALSSGPTFAEAGNGFARLNFATSPEILTEGVRRMAAALGRDG